jgi:hypothetical protein
MEFAITIVVVLVVGGIIGLYKKNSEKIEKENQFRSYEEKKKQDIEKSQAMRNAKVVKTLERKKTLALNWEKYHSVKKTLLLEFDKNNDGEIDLISELDFGELLKNNQTQIALIDKNYIQKFVKISNYIIAKKNNIVDLYKRFLFTDITEESMKLLGFDFHYKRINDISELIKLEMHTYESIIFHSISMITALQKNDLITFYEIFECFDKLGIFNTNWENEISGKLSNITEKLDELIHSITHLEYQIANSLDSLSYTTESSFKELNKSVSGQLSEIGSDLKFNNLLTGIQVYQTHKLNKSMKRLN